jgi:hypothetical protein
MTEEKTDRKDVTTMTFTTILHALKRFWIIFLCGGISTLFMVFVSDPTAFFQAFLPEVLHQYVPMIMAVFGTSIIAAIQRAIKGYLKYDVKPIEGSESPPQ